MLSTCPHCLLQVLHNDQLDRVKCTCGEAFSPFLRVEVSENSPSPMQNSPLMMVNEKNALSDFPMLSNDIPDSLEISENPVLEPLSDFNLESHLPKAEESNPDYSESESVFADIRSFGESLDKTHPDTKIRIEPGASLNQNATAPTISSTDSGILMSSGDSLPGYVINSLLSPISAWCAADTQADDPLQMGFQQLWQKAKNLQADGVIAVRWSFTPDCTKILLTGTCVRCQKS